MLFRGLLKVACMISLVSPWCGTTHATVIETQNHAQWANMVGTFTTIHFNELPNATFVTTQYSHLGVTFTDGSDVILFSPTSFPNDSYGLNGAFDSISVAFSQPVTSIAVDHPGSVQFELYSNGQIVYTSSWFANSGVGFFAGLISTQPFDAARIYDPSGGVFIDDLHFGPPIPAPGGIALLFFAAISLGRRSRL